MFHLHRESWLRSSPRFARKAKEGFLGREESERVALARTLTVITEIRTSGTSREKPEVDSHR